MNKSLLILFLVSILYSVANAQDTLPTIYLDEYWQETTQKNATYYRKVVRQNYLFYVYDYYLNGQLQMSGCCEDGSCDIQTDTFRFYYPNGKLKSQCYYQNNRVIGKSVGFFEDGLPDYVCNKKENTQKCVYYHRNGMVSAIEEFEHDTILKAAKFFEPSGEVSTNRYVIIRPTFEGYEDGFYKYLEKKMYYPEDPQGNRIYGNIKFYITIDTLGKAHWGEVEGFADPYLVIALQGLTKKMPLWSPAIIHNRKTEYKVYQNINFTKE